MIEQVADNMQQIVALFHPTQILTIPQSGDNWIDVEAVDLSEAAALCLALSLFLRQVGNRAEQLKQSKYQRIETNLTIIS